MKMKYCPKGFICIEQITMAFLFLLVIIVGYFVYVSFIKKMHRSTAVHVNNNPKIIIQKENQGQGNQGFGGFGFGFAPNIPYNNFPADVLRDPYIPPLRDERYLIPEFPSSKNYGIPINMNTNINVVDTVYRQVGLLTPLHPKSQGKILALMGRPVNLGRDTWNYYTMSDQNNSVKLPVIRKKKSCTGEYGCDKLYEGDIVFVQGYNQAFKTTIYDNDTIRYIPFL